MEGRARSPRMRAFALLTIALVATSWLALAVGAARAAINCGAGDKTWIASSPDANWFNAANWSGSAVPGPTDTACITIAPPGGTVQIATGATAEIARLKSSIPIAVSAGALQIDSTTLTSTTGSSATLSLSGGSLQGAGSISVGGTLNWTGGSMSDAGVTAISSSGSLAISGSSNKFLGRTISIASGATATMSGTGSIGTLTGADVEIAGTFDISSDDGFFVQNAFGQLNVLAGGTFSKSAGAGTSSATANAVTNSGTIQVSSGTLALPGFTNAGVVRIDPAGILHTSAAFVQAKNASLRIGIAGTSPGVDQGQLQSSAGFTEAGNLTFLNDPSFNPALNTVLTLATYTSHSGAFKTFTNQVLSSGLAYKPSSGHTAFTLKVRHAVDLGVTGLAPAGVSAGQNITYTLTVHNFGPAAAANSKLTDTLPGGVVFVSANSTQGTCTFSSPKVKCSLGTVPSGTDVTITIVVTAPSVGTLTNKEAVTTSDADLLATNNSATQVTTVT